MADGEIVFEGEPDNLRKKGYCWTREETLLLISLYAKRESMFKNVNFKKKEVWRLIESDIRREGCNARADQCDGKWKALTLAYRKCEDHNNRTGNDRKECPFYSQLSELYGYRPNVRPYATASSSGNGDSKRPENAQTEQEDTDTGEDVIPSTSRQPKRKRIRLGSAERDKNECLEWFKEHAEAQRKVHEKREEVVQQQHRDKLQLLSDLLNVLKDFKK